MTKQKPDYEKLENLTKLAASLERVKFSVDGFRRLEVRTSIYGDNAIKDVVRELQVDLNEALDEVKDKWLSHISKTISQEASK